MDPFPSHDPFSSIPKLYPMEFQLIAQVPPCFKAYILPANGDYAYKDHVCNIEQDVTTFFSSYLLN